MSDAAEDLFARWVEHHVVRGETLDPVALCADRPDLLPEVRALIARYLDVSGSLDGLARGLFERDRAFFYSRLVVEEVSG